MRHFLLPFALAAAVAGCGDTPTAPPLSNSPVYRDESAGFRFLAPEGWVMTARSSPPAGPLRRTTIMVHYQSPFADQPGDFHVFAAEVPDAADIGKHIEDHPIGPDKWVLRGEPEPATVNGAAATRYQFGRAVAKPGKKERKREILAFRRAGRVYLFVVTYNDGDGTVRDKIRTLMNGITWDS